jgi:hypothetical protein
MAIDVCLHKDLKYFVEVAWVESVMMMCKGMKQIVPSTLHFVQFDRYVCIRVCVCMCVRAGLLQLLTILPMPDPHAPVCHNPEFETPGTWIGLRSPHPAAYTQTNEYLIGDDDANTCVCERVVL